MQGLTSASWPLSKHCFAASQGSLNETQFDLGMSMTMTPSTASVTSSSFATDPPMPKQLVQAVHPSSIVRAHEGWVPLATGQPLPQPVLFSVQVQGCADAPKALGTEMEFSTPSKSLPCTR